jgi:alkane 1-monooxygenase
MSLIESPEGVTQAERQTPDGQSAPRWRDPKRYAWLLGLVVPTLPFLAWWN